MAALADCRHGPGVRQRYIFTTLQPTHQYAAFDPRAAGKWRRLYFAMQPHHWFVSLSHPFEDMSIQT